MTAFASVPLEALANDLVVAARVASTVVVAFVTADKFSGTNSTRVENVFGKIGETFLTTARVGAFQIEALCMFGAIVVLRTSALVEIFSYQTFGTIARGVKIGTAQGIIITAQVLFKDVLQSFLIGTVR